MFTMNSNMEEGGHKTSWWFKHSIIIRKLL